MRTAMLAWVLGAATLSACAMEGGDEASRDELEREEISGKADGQELRLGTYERDAASMGRLRTGQLTTVTFVAVSPGAGHRDVDGTFSGKIVTRVSGAVTRDVSGDFLIFTRPSTGRRYIKLVEPSGVELAFLAYSYVGDDIKLWRDGRASATEYRLTRVRVPAEVTSAIDRSCETTRVRNDSYFEESLSVDEYPTVSITRAADTGHVDVRIGGNHFDDGEDGAHVTLSRPAGKLRAVVDLGDLTYTIDMGTSTGTVSAAENGGRAVVIADLDCS